MQITVVKRSGQKEPNPPKTMPPATPWAKVPYLLRNGKAPFGMGAAGQNGATGQTQ